MSVNFQTIEKLRPMVTEPYRYRVLYGGRGGLKSYFFADMCIMRALQKKTRILCVREIQGSIKDSVHRLLCDRIEALGVSKSFNITEKSITAFNGSNFIFKGLLRNITEIKSTEGVSICWAEEAENISSASWEILLPTIRKKGSEIWIGFNPRYEDDDTYKRWVVNPPDNALVIKVNYSDNPWFPDVLRKEMEQDKARDHQLYLQKWEGYPVGLGGRVWPTFDKQRHVRTFEREKIINEGMCLMGMDPHAHYYPAIVWGAVIPKNKRMNWREDFWVHIYAEYPSFDDLQGYYHDLRQKLKYEGTLAEMSKMIYAREGYSEGIKVIKRFVDTRFAKGSGSTNWSTNTTGMATQWAKPENGGLLLDLPPEKTIDIQRQVITDDLFYNKHAPESEFNMPNLSIDPSCKNLIASLSNHRLEEGKEKESEKYKDFSDALRIMFAGLDSMRYKTKQVTQRRLPPRSGHALAGKRF